MAAPAPKPKVFVSAADADQLKEAVCHDTDQSLADLFNEQVEAFYSLPRKGYPRKEIAFSPSGVTKCARELYYQNVNASLDEREMIPWRERMSRNGTGVHEITQTDYKVMERELKKAGQLVRFRFLEAEVKGEKSYDVNGYTVKLRGRCDGKVGLLDDEGNVVKVIGWEKKTKDKRKNLNKLIKAGQPQDEHRQQAVAYALIWGIADWIFEYEALQKPEWGDLEPEKPDLAHFYVTVDRQEAKALLIRLAKIVKAIEQGELPPAELDRCGFCAYHERCADDGGYRDK